MYFLLQFQEFETEKSFDTVQILVGGRTEDKAVNLATLSGKLELSNKLFLSASNFMIVKFSTDGSVERKGFRYLNMILKEISHKMGLLYMHVLYVNNVCLLFLEHLGKQNLSHVEAYYMLLHKASF